MNQRSYWKFLRARSFEIGVQEQKSLKFDVMRELRDRENKTAVDYRNQIIDNKVWVYRL